MVITDLDVPSATPLHPASECSLGTDIEICETDRACQGIQADSCTVICWGDTCRLGNFENSLVQCFDRDKPQWLSVDPGDACVGARFKGSGVICGWNCVGASFEASYVTCGPNGCPGTSFDECSCCDGPGCPSSAAPCEGNVENICRKEVGGETCACRGFIGCPDDAYGACQDQRPSTPGLPPTLSGPGGAGPGVEDDRPSPSPPGGTPTSPSESSSNLLRLYGVAVVVVAVSLFSVMN